MSTAVAPAYRRGKTVLRWLVVAAAGLIMAIPAQPAAAARWAGRRDWTCPTTIRQ
ncbi:hypothetical protein [Fodinicola feengrottensis]|uniref:hypothetical protein n=1 Tax=Fodinicola feengrottensis TaxID=435914 RepID=UPI0024411567|nr:hypothetical protein [Fodinicola feengrottensis]